MGIFLNLTQFEEQKRLMNKEEKVIFNSYSLNKTMAILYHD